MILREFVHAVSFGFGQGELCLIAEEQKLRIIVAEEMPDCWMF